MNSDVINTNVYTPEQVAEMLQLSKQTVYDLIKKGEIVAKKIGKVYRIPRQSLSFIFTGLDEDIYKAQQEDKKSLEKIHEILSNVRSSL